MTATLGLGCAARSALPREVRHVGAVGCAAPDVWRYGSPESYEGRRADLVIRCWRLKEAAFRRGDHDVARPPAGGDRDACRGYARILAGVYAGSGDEKITPSKVRALLGRLCADNDVEACTDLGEFLRSRGPEQNEVTANDLLAAACKGGSERGCLLYGKENGLEGQVVLWESCARGFVRACEVASSARVAFRCGDYPCDSPSSRLPLAYLCMWTPDATACQRGRWEAPADVVDVRETLAAADELLLPTDTREPTARARQAATQIEALVAMCEAGPAPSPCVLLAYASVAPTRTREMQLHRVALQKRTASGWLERACDLGDATACFLAGAPLVHADCPGVDHPRGLPMLHRSCDLGDPFGCESVAALYETGYGVTRDPVRAAKLRQRSVELRAPPRRAR